jgi:hypothetical protein
MIRSAYVRDQGVEDNMAVPSFIIYALSGLEENYYNDYKKSETYESFAFFA